MASNYPTSLDSFSTGHIDGVNEVIHASDINNQADAINKIEAELGINPSGSFATVAAAIAAGSGGFSYPQSAMQVWVSYQTGSDSNNGLSPSLPFKTIQAAYNALKTYAESTYLNQPSGSMLGVGQINLLPGYHDLVGTPLVFTGNRPVKIVGNSTGARVWYSASSQATIISSTDLATFVRIGINTANTEKGQGFSFENVAFLVSPTLNTSTTKVIWASVIGDFHVENCSFGTTTNATNLSCVAIYHDDLTTSAGEAGWFRIIRNFSAQMALYQANTASGAAGGNFNRGIVEGNVCFYGGSLAMVGFYANTNASTIANNNFEGPAVGVEMGGNGTFSNNLFLNNAGEDQTSTTPGTFYNFSGSVGGSYVLGGECVTTNATTPGAWVTFATNAYPNHVYSKDASLTGVTGRKTKIVNNATYPTRNVIEGKDGRIFPYKSAAGAAYTSADWPAIPDNGTVLGIANDTTTGKASIYFAAGGTIRRVVEP